MKLSAKVFMYIAVAIFLFLLVLYTVLRPLLLEDPIKSDEYTAENDMERVKNQWQADMDGLARTNRDWAVWDDTYRYIKGEMPDYPEKNLTSQTFENNLIDFILFFDQNNQLVYQKGYDASLAPLALDNTLSMSYLPILTKKDDINQTLLVETPYGLTFSAFHPILDSGGNGPAMGTMIMARVINQEDISKIGQTLSLPLVWTKVKPNEKTSLVNTRIVGEDTLLTQLTLTEELGRSTYEIQLETKRSFYLQRKVNIRYLSIYLFIASILLMIMIHILLHRLVLDRVRQLSEQLLDIQDHQNMSSRIRVRDGNKDEITLLVSSINQMLSSLEESHAQVKRLAYMDTLTSLPNRHALEQLFDKKKSKTKEIALLFFDLDGFKLVNDQLGHKAGDVLLQVIATRTEEIMVQCGGFAARFGGDEFLVIVCDQTKERLFDIAEVILTAVSEPIEVGENQCFVTASIGISHSPEHGTSLEELIKKADRAMYRAKRLGKSQYVMFEEDYVFPLEGNAE